MNALAVERLVAAGLNGTRQIKGKFYDGEGGFCANGVLWAALESPETWRRKESVVSGTYYVPSRVDQSDFRAAYGIADDEFYSIVRMNNCEDLDFIAIARKLGPDAA